MSKNKAEVAMVVAAVAILLWWCWYLTANASDFVHGCEAHQTQATGVIGGEAVVLCVDRQ